MYYYLTLFFSLLVMVLTYLTFKWYQKASNFSHLPTPKYLLPIFGHSLRVPNDVTKILDFHGKMFEETKSKLRVIWLGFLPIIGVYDVNVGQSMLKSSSYIDKGATYGLLVEWLGDGLLLSEGEKWKRRRRLLTPAFHFGILKSNTSVLNSHATKLVEHLKEQIKIHSKINVEALFKHVALSIICETALGVYIDPYENTESLSEESKYIAAVDEILWSLTKRYYKPWLHNKFIYKYFSSDGKRYYKTIDTINNYVRKTIESQISSLDNKSITESGIFVDILIGAYRKNEIDVDGIMEEVNTFMFAGHDTTSSALSWTLHILGKNEHVQNKLYEEIIQCKNEELDKETVSELRYLDCVVKESLRLFPPVPTISRYFKEDTVLGESCKIPARSNVEIHFYQLHRDETLWNDPLVFLPERFLDDQRNDENAYSFLPFSAGPRNCIGQRFALLELKIMLANLVKNFQFLSMQKEEEIEKFSLGILRSVNGVWVKFVSR